MTDDYKRLIDKRWMAIGKSLPFSIYDSQRKLLLAQGHVVESARSLERLMEHGHYYKPEHAGGGDRGVVEEPAGSDPVDPLSVLSRDYSNIPLRARCGVKIAPNEAGESHLCWVIGVSHQSRCLLMTAPMRPDKVLAPISKGQVWFCRTFSPTGVFRFRGAILKVAFEPYPYLHILVPEVIEKHLVRQLPRALASLQATLATPESHDVAVVDLSVGGARIGTDKKLALAVGHSVQLTTTITVPGRRQELLLQAKVAAAHGVADSRHPSIAFYELSFDALDERTTLLLYGCVQQQLASEYYSLGQMLASAGAT